ncbi:VWA domain-containing protein, partial [Candidatus Woesearchaeota archaeon]|nr:VWA domain-containing protein [Candidatus Woesearchaeota archaeon]
LPGEYSEADEMSGSLASSPDEERLMRSVLENDEQTIDDGAVVAESINQGVGSFTPDLMFQNLVQDYRNAKRLYGETLIRALSGYSPDYVRKNVNIPEFQQALQQQIEENVEALKNRGVLDEQGGVTERAIKLAALVTYTEELDHLVSKGLGRKAMKERDIYGEKEDAVPYKKGKFRFRDISLRRSVKTAVRRGHDEVQVADLQAHERAHKGRIQVVYAMDASGSMRGKKLAMSKRAGVALAYRAVEERNEVGLVVFTSKVEESIAPTQDFKLLLQELVRIHAGQETDLAKTILHSVTLFAKEECTKHLLFLTDAVPTKGKDPWRETLEAAGIARDNGVTISIVGISLDDEGEKLARKVVEVGQGRLYRVTDIEELDAVILEDYDAL